MLENLTQKLNGVIKYLKGEGRITENNIQKALREIKLSLLEADVNYKVVKAFIARIQKQSLGEKVIRSLTPYQHITRIVQDEIRKLLGSETASLSEADKKPSVLMLVGLQGTGKTTTAGKLARYLTAKRKKSVMLCSVDLKRPAAQEQLGVIAAEVGVPLYRVQGDSPVRVIRKLRKEAADQGYDYVIVDTAGRTHVNQELMDELKLIQKKLQPVETLFIADSVTGQDAVTSATAFSEGVGIDSIVLTKLDADSRGGAALSIVSVTGKPIKFIGVGEKHEDFEVFHPDRLASKILGMGDVLTLIEKAEEEFDEKETRRISRKMMKNRFDLEDFKQQMQQMRKLGSLQDIVKMLPGKMGNMAGGGLDAGTAMDEKKITHTIAIINSMTPGERSAPKVINGRRRLRISRGSGRPVQEVNELLKNFRNMKKMMQKPLFRKMFGKFDF